MDNRQTTRLFILIPLLFGLWACSPNNQTLPTPVISPPTATQTPISPTLTIHPSPTPTLLTCLSQPGDLQTGEVATEGRPTAFIIYLPPCYEQMPEERYPVLYLLHGQTYTADQWVRIGAPEAADELIHANRSIPFIIVFPEDRYWNLQQGTRFGQYLLNDVIPYIDENYRTLADRAHRSLGGLSRGAGWAFQIGINRPDLFASLGLHSPAILSTDRGGLERRIRELDSNLWPRLYMDMGDNDHEFTFNIQLEEWLTQYEIPHEWHLNSGAHDEEYWSKHVEEYIQWYAAGWAQP